jgi:L-asparaginase type I
MARVLVIYTGGTIGMRETARGFGPEPGFLAERLARLPQLQDPSMPAHDLLEYTPLLDSSNMGMEDWARVASDIGARYDAYDGFVVLHGTDTMAYTASALSFMLENLAKTVVLTGSQISLAHVRNDAVENLLGALALAGGFAVPEVGLYFHDKLLRGNRAQKVDASGFDAFASGNYPPLAVAGVELEVKWPLVRPAPVVGAKLAVRTAMEPNVAALRLFPGITTAIVENYLRPPLRGLVLETYGTGNAPDRRTDLLQALRAATDRGVVIVNCTQCHRGTVNPSYATGKALLDAGVVGGADMTPEAALAKLSFLLGSGTSVEDVRRAVQLDLRGELTARRTGAG